MLTLLLSSGQASSSSVFAAAPGKKQKQKNIGHPICPDLFSNGGGGPVDTGRRRRRAHAPATDACIKGLCDRSRLRLGVNFGMMLQAFGSLNVPWGFRLQIGITACKWPAEIEGTASATGMHQQSLTFQWSMNVAEQLKQCVASAEHINLQQSTGTSSTLDSWSST